MNLIIDGKKYEANIRRHIKIEIDNVVYTISKSNDEKLTVNKFDPEGECLKVYPRYANQIDIE